MAGTQYKSVQLLLTRPRCLGNVRSNQLMTAHTVMSDTHRPTVNVVSSIQDTVVARWPHSSRHAVTDPRRV